MLGVGAGRQGHQGEIGVTIVEEHVFPVSREELWGVLHDAQQMSKWIPGCEDLVEVAPDRYAATLKVGVASIKGTYTGFVEIRDKQFPDRYTLAVSGNATPGFVKGVATMELFDTADGNTRLVVNGNAQVGGLIASVGQRFLTGIARQMTQQLLRNIEKEVLEAVR
jgi:carbon monoxide dehydrogenase subunit G